MKRTRTLALLLGLAGTLLVLPVVVHSCPFCSAVSMTFCEEVGQADVAVIAKLVELPPQSADPSQNATATIQPAQFEITEVLKGQDLVGKEKRFETLYFGSEPVGKQFLVMAMHEDPRLAWATPIAINEAVPAYLKKALSLPKEGADRLAFFQDYLESSNEMLARDAYDEFAKAPYKDVLALKDRMKHKQLVEWIKDPKVTASHRRLYLTMLGVCGDEKDADMLGEMLKDDSPTGKPGMDAMVAAYLTLKGPKGLPLVEDLFLKNQDAEYTETYATIMALRFHGQEEDVIPKERLIEAMRHMLERPQLADLVIPDLARWEDWGSMEKMVKLFKESDDESGWVRVPVINYLRACPLPEAKKQLDELAKLDPESMKRADSFFPLGGGVGPAPADGNKTETAGEKPAEEAKGGSAKADEEEDIPDASEFVDPKENGAAAPARKSDSRRAADDQASASRVGAAAALLSPKRIGSKANPVSTGKILGGLAAVGLTVFALMIAAIGGGQHVTG